MDKPKILMLDQPCEEACRMIDEVAERVEHGRFPDYVWTGLTPTRSYVPTFCPCTGVDHINAPEIIHLDAEWKRNEGKWITSTAEHTLSLMLQLAKKKGIELSGKTVVIIGAGRIGCKIARYTASMGAGVYTYDVGEEHDHAIEEIFNFADIITLHVPLNDETRHMIGKKEIAMMKPGALLINTSRQEVVDIEAVKEALISKKIYYADDFQNKVDLTEYGAIQTPHIGGNCKEAREMTDIYIAKQLVKYINKNI